jgi:DNA cross-link repair 1A protein
VQYAFPPQEECLASLGELARMEAQRDPSTVFYVGTYTIGKEKAVKAVAQVRHQKGGTQREKAAGVMIRNETEQRDMAARYADTKRLSPCAPVSCDGCAGAGYQGVRE